MENENLNPLEQSVREFLPANKVLPHVDNSQKYQTCKKCGSPFITETECESCGFQRVYDIYGKPFGPKSFYSLKADFWHSLGLIASKLESLTWWKTVRKKHYLNRLELRFNDLSRFLCLKAFIHDSRRSLFLIEYIDLISELKELGFTEKDVWMCLRERDFPAAHERFQDFSRLIQLALKSSERRVHRGRDGQSKLGLSSFPVRGVLYGISATLCAFILSQLPLMEFF